MNIIGDVAGRFDELMLLVEKMPKDDFLFVGDLNDRGPDSPKVIEWVMKNAKCLNSNHGDMFVDYIEGTNLYQDGIFLYNGGEDTLDSYDGKDNVPNSHIEWLKNLPYYHEDENLLISHAALNPLKKLEDCCYRGAGAHASDSFLWNRGEPEEQKGKLQVFGHNSHWGLRYFGEKENPWAICLDQSGKGILTGIHYPSLKIFTQDYLMRDYKPGVINPL